MYKGFLGLLQKSPIDIDVRSPKRRCTGVHLLFCQEDGEKLRRESTWSVYSEIFFLVTQISQAKSSNPTGNLQAVAVKVISYDAEER